jgi:hypothetical protein
MLTFVLVGADAGLLRSDLPSVVRGREGALLWPRKPNRQVRIC